MLFKLFNTIKNKILFKIFNYLLLMKKCYYLFRSFEKRKEIIVFR